VAVNLLTSFEKKNNQLSDSEQQDAVFSLLLHMAWVDGHADEAEIHRIVQIMARKYQSDEATIRHELASIQDTSQEDIDALAQILRNSISVPNRLELAKELWEIALVDGAIDSYEKLFFQRVLDLLGITE